MIDLKKLRQDPKRYEQKTKSQWLNIDFDELIKLDEQIRNMKSQIDELSSHRNSISKEIAELQKEWKDPQEHKEKVKEIKTELDQKQKDYDELYQKFYDIYIQIPNPPLDDVIYWESDDDNAVIYYSWDKPKFDFEPLPHYELLEQRDMLDQKRSAKVAGTRFYYIKDWLVKLELALINYAIDVLIKKWFRPVMWPNLVRYDTMLGAGFFPAEKNEVYKVNPGEDDLYLIWTSEAILVGQHMNETIDLEELPLRYAWFSPCYRREAGSYGKDTKWMIRVHQFEKVEMVSFTSTKDSYKEHEFLTEIEEEIVQNLWIHYQKIDICTWDVWFHAAKKYDLEAWFPGLDSYKEITSCSNCTDFQARRAKIKYKDGQEKDFLHTLNWTAIAVGRVMACIVENNQTKDMKIKIPKVLQNYMNAEEI